MIPTGPSPRDRRQPKSSSSELTIHKAAPRTLGERPSLPDHVDACPKGRRPRHPTQFSVHQPMTLRTREGRRHHPSSTLPKRALPTMNATFCGDRQVLRADTKAPIRFLPAKTISHPSIQRCTSREGDDPEPLFCRVSSTHRGHHRRGRASPT
jgi:hypothetical protein